MSKYDYTRGYSKAELEALLIKAKAEREKYLSGASDSGSSYSRIAQAEIEEKISGILDALEILDPTTYKSKAGERPRFGVWGRVIQ